MVRILNNKEYTEIVKGKELLEKYIKGAQAVCDVVSETMGLNGNFVCLLDGRISNDGIDSIKNFVLEDRAENEAVEKIIQASDETNYRAGDFTTGTATIASNIIIKFGNLILDNYETLTRRRVKEFLDTIKKSIIVNLKSDKIKVDFMSDNELKKLMINIATISVKDKELGNLVGSAIHESGMMASYKIDSSFDGLNSYIAKSGYNLMGGMPIHQVKSELTIIENTNLLLMNVNLPNKINTDWLEQMISEVPKNKNLTLISNAWHPDTVSIIEKYFQDEMDEGNKVYFLEIKVNEGKEINLVWDDLKDYIGAKYIYEGKDGISPSGHNSISEFNPKGITLIDKISFQRTQNGIYGKIFFVQNKDKQDKKVLKDKIKEFEKIIEKNPSDQFTKKRLSRMTSKDVEFKLNIKTEIELQMITSRIDDAIKSCRKTMVQGAVAGGGVALKDLALDKYKLTGTTDDELKSDLDEFGFIDALSEVLTYNFTKLTGKTHEEALGFEKGIGIETDSQEKVNMVEAGVVDSYYAIIIGVINAFEIASTLLLTSVSLFESQKEKGQ